MEEHAQLEINRYATVIGNEIVRRWCPLAWEANNGWLSRGSNGIKQNREREELEAKLTSLHLPFPWDKRGIK
jgi:hypothetical protein